jgi:hypothetical protein
VQIAEEGNKNGSVKGKVPCGGLGDGGDESFTNRRNGQRPKSGCTGLAHVEDIRSRDKPVPCT